MHPAQEEELILLWQSRASHSSAAWTRLYGLVFAALKKCNARELQLAGGSKEQWIQDYFVLKLFEPATWHSSPPHHIGALCAYFTNYLRDYLKSAAHRYEILGDDPETVEGVADDGAARDYTQSLLFESGLSDEGVRSSARQFLAGLDEWGRCYLAMNACPDEAQALSGLAQQMQIASYHYKALQLGITRKKGEFYAGYDKTQIGQWLTQNLNLEITPEYAQEILVAFKILCDEALKEYRHLNG